MRLDAFQVANSLATTLVIVLALGTVSSGVMAQPARGLPTRPILPPANASTPLGAPTGLVNACATFDYQGADGARNMGMRVLTTGQQFVLQAEGNGVVVHTDYPSPNIPSANAVAVFDALRAAWTARRAVVLGINPQGRLDAANVQLGGAQQC